MMPNYEKKLRYLMRKTHGVCPIALEKDGFSLGVTELHHIVHNTKVNRKLFPLLIHSVWNLVAVNHSWHMEYPTWGRRKDWQLEARRRESFLQRHPMMARRLNMED